VTHVTNNVGLFTIPVWENSQVLRVSRAGSKRGENSGAVQLTIRQQIALGISNWET